MLIQRRLIYFTHNSGSQTTPDELIRAGREKKQGLSIVEERNGCDEAVGRGKITTLPPSSFGLPRTRHKGRGGGREGSSPQAGAARAAVMMPWLPSGAQPASSTVPANAVIHATFLLADWNSVDSQSERKPSAQSGLGNVVFLRRPLLVISCLCRISLPRLSSQIYPSLV